MELWSAWSGCTKTCGGVVGLVVVERWGECMEESPVLVLLYTQRETCNSTPCPGTWGSLLINHASFMYTKALVLAQVPPACYYKYSLGQLIS